jgi:hypothetical protein
MGAGFAPRHSACCAEETRPPTLPPERMAPVRTAKFARGPSPSPQQLHGNRPWGTASLTTTRSSVSSQQHRLARSLAPTVRCCAGTTRTLGRQTTTAVPPKLPTSTACTRLCRRSSCCLTRCGEPSTTAPVPGRPESAPGHRSTFASTARRRQRNHMLRGRAPDVLRLVAAPTAVNP